MKSEGGGNGNAQFTACQSEVQVPWDLRQLSKVRVVLWE